MLRNLLLGLSRTEKLLFSKTGAVAAIPSVRNAGHKRLAPLLRSNPNRALSNALNTREKLSRGNYARLEKEDIDALSTYMEVSRPIDPVSRQEAASSVCITSADQLRTYNTDWTGQFQGNSRLCLRPSNAEAIAAALSYCNRRKLAVTPQGGNTGLVGGSVPVFDEIIISMSRMNRILALDEEHGTISVEAGVTLGQAESFCRQHGFSFPLDLGAKDSCQIGGNLSTNAGGSRYVRFGSLHGTILGLEVVLADGTILDLGTSRQIRKDNTGYDLKHLFIGSEGTLGIITKATLACAPAPHRTQVALAGIAGAFPRVRHWLREARHHLAERLYAFEVMDAESMTLIHSSIADFRDPFREPYAFYILIETSISSADEQAASSPLESWLEKMTQSDSASDVILAQDLTQCASLWQLRESLPELVRQSSPTVLKYDLSLPLPVFYEIVERTRERLRHQALDAHVYSWGHLADSNLHLNVASHVPQAILRAAVEPWLYDWTSQHGGSCSAEHGIGRLKSHLLARTKGAATLAVMKQVKTLLDPNGILNPYKLFEPGS